MFLRMPNTNFALFFISDPSFYLKIDIFTSSSLLLLFFWGNFFPLIYYIKWYMLRVGSPQSVSKIPKFLPKFQDHPGNVQEKQHFQKNIPWRSWDCFYIFRSQSAHSRSGRSFVILFEAFIKNSMEVAQVRFPARAKRIFYVSEAFSTFFMAFIKFVEFFKYFHIFFQIFQCIFQIFPKEIRICEETL